MITITINGEPRGKGRPRFGCGHAYTDAKTRAYEKLVQQTYLATGGKRLTGPVRLFIVAHHGIPASWNKAARRLAMDGKVPATRKPDADNISKIIMDALNSVAWEDDRQVVSLTVLKHYTADEAYVSVMIDDATEEYAGSVTYDKA